MQKEQEIYIGAIGDKNLELAGQISDGAIVTMYPLSKLSHALEALERSNTSGKKKTLFLYLPVSLPVIPKKCKARKLRLPEILASTSPRWESSIKEPLCLGV